ncbi:hypothetical protein P171DRAFT_236712 [Karstenula rhodostoma CBS 690.94]|uniref:Uncharacterized protein n=1 Tax=Karstenula rhodostoma CBS 690.94 TaxID=1392251 RepID=A0A9P4PMU0_9PLEO|nr:hypothetical protein P171DRAFT_236712 [Karstenula rhodostoma CBS 690.94]
MLYRSMLLQLLCVPSPSPRHLHHHAVNKHAIIFDSIHNPTDTVSNDPLYPLLPTLILPIALLHTPSPKPLPLSPTHQSKMLPYTYTASPSCRYTPCSRVNGPFCTESPRSHTSGCLKRHIYQGRPLPKPPFPRVCRLDVAASIGTFVRAVSDGEHAIHQKPNQQGYAPI